MDPLVSILIPAYNAEAFIADTILSALAQSWQRKEIVVVDDGSTDETLRRAREFRRSNVQVIHQSNRGAASARNRALRACQGDYVQWLDADDLLSTDKIARQVEVLRACGSRMLASARWGYFRYRPRRAAFVPSPLWHDLEPVEWILRKWETNSHMQTATWLVPRELTEVAGPWDTRLLGDDDGEYFSRVILHSDGIRFVPGASVYYRISPSTRLSYIGASNAKIDAQFLGMELQIRNVRAVRDSERVRAACTTYLETWMTHFYPNRPDIVRRASALARSWGGEVRMPRLPRKYDWIRRVFGWSAAKYVQRRYNVAKADLARTCDRALLKAEGGTIDVGNL